VMAVTDVWDEKTSGDCVIAQVPLRGWMPRTCGTLH
jgi:hypothetical protein